MTVIDLHLFGLRLQCARRGRHLLVRTALGACCSHCGSSWEVLP